MRDIPDKNNILTIISGEDSYKAIATGKWNVLGFDPDGTPRIVIEMLPQHGRPQYRLTKLLKRVTDIQAKYQHPAEGDTVNTARHKGTQILSATSEGFYISIGKGSRTQISAAEILAYNPKYYE